MAENIGTATVTIRPDTGNFQNEARSKLGGAFGGISKVGVAAFAAVGVAATGLATKVLSTAIQFEDSFAGVRKTVDATEAEFAQLAEQFRKMSREIPVSVNELNRIGEAAGALGIKKSAILDFTKTVAQLAVTTNLSSDEAANALARIANIMGTAQEDFDNLGSAIVALGNAGASTEREIVDMALRISGAGKTVGLTEAQVLGFASALASVGIEAEAGGTAISRVFVTIAQSVANGDQKLEDFARTSGVSVAQFKKEFEVDAAGATIKFIEGLGKIQEEGGNVFGVLEKLELGDIRVRDALLRAAGAGELFRTQLVLSGKAYGENTALQIEAEKRFATTKSQLILLKNEFADLALRLGNTLLPSLRKLLDFLLNLEGPALRIAQAVGILAAALGVLVIATRIYTAVQAALNVVLSANPIGLIVLAIAALVAGLIWAWKHSETFRDIVKGVFQVVKAQVEIAVAVFKKIIEVIGNIISWIRDKFGPIVTPIIMAIGIVFRGIGDAIEWVIDMIKKVIDWFKKLANKLPDWLKPGSPSPLETALAGIGDQMRKLNRMEPLLLGVGPLGSARAGGGVTIASGAVQLNFSGPVTPETVPVIQHNTEAAFRSLLQTLEAGRV